MLTVVGDAPWLSALLRTASALVSMPAVRLLAEDDDDKDKDDDDAGDKYNYDPGHGPPRFVGWLAAHILVIVDRPTTDAVFRAIRLLAPPAQYDPILVIMFSVTTMVRRSACASPVRRQGWALSSPPTAPEHETLSVCES